MHHFVFLFILFLFVGCSSHYRNDITPKEYNTYKSASDALYYLASDDITRHHGQTGFYPLPHYYDAFIARYELIRAAKRSIDMQYFIFASDEVSTLFMEEIVKAVDRGGKVRIQSGLESVL